MTEFEKFEAFKYAIKYLQDNNVRISCGNHWMLYCNDSHGYALPERISWWRLSEIAMKEYKRENINDEFFHIFSNFIHWEGVTYSANNESFVKKHRKYIWDYIPMAFRDSVFKTRRMESGQHV